MGGSPSVQAVQSRVIVEESRVRIKREAGEQLTRSLPPAPAPAPVEEGYEGEGVWGAGDSVKVKTYVRRKNGRAFLLHALERSLAFANSSATRLANAAKSAVTREGKRQSDEAVVQSQVDAERQRHAGKVDDVEARCTVAKANPSSSKSHLISCKHCCLSLSLTMCECANLTHPPTPNPICNRAGKPVGATPEPHHVRPDLRRRRGAVRQRHAAVHNNVL